MIEESTITVKRHLTPSGKVPTCCSSFATRQICPACSMRDESATCGFTGREIERWKEGRGTGYLRPLAGCPVWKEIEHEG